MGPNRLVGGHAPRSALALALLAVVLGTVAGFGALGFRALIGLCHNLLFLGRVSVTYDTNAQTPPSPWGPGVALMPAAGALGATGAALTAIVMIFEMTLDYSVVLPMTLTVAVAYGLRRALFAESIYTMKLARRGHPMPSALQANAYLVHHVTDLRLDPATTLAASTPGTELPLGEGKDAPAEIVLLDRGHVTGVLARAWALEHREEVARAPALEV